MGLEESREAGISMDGYIYIWIVAVGREK